MFVTFEGGEGAGKTTQVKLLAQTLAERGLQVVQTREPGGTAHAECIRRLLLEQDGWDSLTELLLLFAARREHVVKLLMPSLKKGAVVLSDRFVDSTMVYQGYVQGNDQELIARLARMTLGNIWPDLTIILDVNPDIGLARAAVRGDVNRYEAESLDFHYGVQEGFRATATHDPERCVLINANRSVGAVAAHVLAEFDKACLRAALEPSSTGSRRAA